MIVIDGKPQTGDYTLPQLAEAAFRLLESDNPVLIEIGTKVYSSVEDYVMSLVSLDD